MKPPRSSWAPDLELLAYYLVGVTTGWLAFAVAEALLAGRLP